MLKTIPSSLFLAVLLASSAKEWFSSVAGNCLPGSLSVLEGSGGEGGGRGDWDGEHM